MSVGWAARVRLATGSSFTVIGRWRLSSQSPNLPRPLPSRQATGTSAGSDEVGDNADRCGWLGIGRTRASVGGGPASAALVRAGCVSVASGRRGLVDTGAAAVTDAREDRPGPASRRALFPSPDEYDAVLLLWPRSASASRSSRARPGLVVAMLARVRPASASIWARSCRPQHLQCESHKKHLLNTTIVRPLI